MPALFARHSQRTARSVPRALIDLGVQYLDALALALTPSRLSYVFVDGRNPFDARLTPRRVAQRRSDQP